MGRSLTTDPVHPSRMPDRAARVCSNTEVQPAIHGKSYSTPSSGRRRLLSAIATRDARAETVNPFGRSTPSANSVVLSFPTKTTPASRSSLTHGAVVFFWRICIQPGLVPKPGFHSFDGDNVLDRKPPTLATVCHHDRHTTSRVVVCSFGLGILLAEISSWKGGTSQEVRATMRSKVVSAPNQSRKPHEYLTRV